MNDRVSAKYRERAETILDNDVQPIIQDAEKKRVGPVAKVWDQVQGLVEYVKDPDAPKAGKIVAVAALIYLVNPFDVVPATVRIAPAIAALPKADIHVHAESGARLEQVLGDQGGREPPS